MRRIIEALVQFRNPVLYFVLLGLSLLFLNGRSHFHQYYLEKYSLIGTTEVEVNSAINPCITSEEKDYLIESINRFSAKKIKEQDILWSYSGVRPLIQDSTDSMSKNSRDYHLDNQLNSERLIHIYGGKLTTYRKLSEKVLIDLKKFLPKTKKGPWTDKKRLF